MNKKSYVLTLINKGMSYTLQVFDFFDTTTLVVKLKNRIKLVVSITISYALIITMKIKTIRLVISKTSLIYSNSVVVNLYRMKLVATTKAIGKLTATLNNLVKLVVSTKMIGKLTVVNNLHRMKLVLDMALGEFTELIVHDPELLEDIDPLTLEDLDFTTI